MMDLLYVLAKIKAHVTPIWPKKASGPVVNEASLSTAKTMIDLNMFLGFKINYFILLKYEIWKNYINKKF